jgi:hypothetical protein
MSRATNLQFQVAGGDTHEPDHRSLLAGMQYDLEKGQSDFVLSVGGKTQWNNAAN